MSIKCDSYDQAWIIFIDMFKAGANVKLDGEKFIVHASVLGDVEWADHAAA